MLQFAFALDATLTLAVEDPYSQVRADVPVTVLRDAAATWECPKKSGHLTLYTNRVSEYDQCITILSSAHICDP
jgi:hypothetical protein